MEPEFPLRTMEALHDLLPELKTIREHFGETTQVSKSLEEMGELKEHLDKFLVMRKAGHSVVLAHSPTASELADSLVLLFQLLLNPDLDEMVAEWIYFKVPRTISRINCGMYGADGILKK